MVKLFFFLFSYFSKNYCLISVFIVYFYFILFFFQDRRKQKSYLEENKHGIQTYVGPSVQKVYYMELDETKATRELFMAE